MQQKSPLKPEESLSVLIKALNLSLEQLRVKDLLVQGLQWTRLDAINQVATADENQLAALERGIEIFNDPIRGLYQYELAKLLSSGESPLMTEESARAFVEYLDEEEIMVCVNAFSEGEGQETALMRHRKSRGA
jgi:hypothetical protein